MSHNFVYLAIFTCIHAHPGYTNPRKTIRNVENNPPTISFWISLLFSFHHTNVLVVPILGTSIQWLDGFIHTHTHTHIYLYMFTHSKTCLITMRSTLNTCFGYLILGYIFYAPSNILPVLQLAGLPNCLYLLIVLITVCHWVNYHVIIV